MASAIARNFMARASPITRGSFHGPRKTFSTNCNQGGGDSGVIWVGAMLGGILALSIGSGGGDGFGM